MPTHLLGPFRLDTEDGLLLRGGEPVNLGRRAIALLRAMVERPGALLSKDALIEAGWSGQSVEESNLTVQIAALRRVLSTSPGGDGWIETMPGRGYRFVGPVVTAAQKEAPEKSAPPRLSMVVLPFANIGGDLEQEHFVDGITESLTTDLSRIRGAVVIARNTAFTYKGKPLDAKQIGRELNVRYVLEGSVQRGGNRMRVNAQLIDAASGNHLWAERFDKPLADLFDMQDEIVARLANALDAQFVAAEARRAEQAPTPDSMDLYFQGMAWLNKGRTRDTIAQARHFFDRALATDPFNVEALIESARADGYAATLFFVTDPPAVLAAADTKLTKALSLAPDHPRGHMWLGYVEIFNKRAARGIAECEHALALDRNLVGAHSIIGMGKIFVGRANETEAHVREVPPAQPARYNGLHLDVVRRRREEPTRQLRGGGDLVSTVDRGQSKSSDSVDSVGLRARAARSTGRGAFRGPGRSRALSRFHPLPRPRRVDHDQRRPDIPGPD